VKGTVTHWIGGGGDGFYLPGATEYQMAGYRQVFVSWNSDWEQTQTSGIKTAACRPATVLKWIFDEPSLHAGSQATAFCGEGHSGGSAQLAFALSHFGLDSILDYVSERAGPPFARIDLGCDHGEPATATVCGDEVTMYYSPSSRVDRQNRWENTTTCGSTTPLASDVMKWNADSISVGGTYNYPNTELQFFDCTYNAPAVTGMAQIYYDQIVQAEGGTSRVGFHCYKQADGCSGEGLGPHGDDEAIRSMIEKCVPNHL
jgi:hypothetical protein